MFNQLRCKLKQLFYCISIFFQLRQWSYSFIFVYMLHSDPLEQTALSLWAFPLPKMSKPTKQRATIVNKYCFCFTHLNLRFSLTLRRVCSPFFSFQTLWHWIAETTAKWEKDYIDRKKDLNQSGSGCFSVVPEEPGNFLVSLPRWLEAQPAGAAGSSWV